jgi:peptidylprolyl isomerase
MVILIRYFCILFWCKARFDELSSLRKQRMRERKARALRRRMIALVVIVLVMASFGAIYYIYGNRPSSEPNSETNKVVLRTSMGDITIQLYEDMPITTGNFRNLVKQGVYDDTIFHRVVSDFVIQGGDASGKGITVATIQDELPNKHSNIRGSVAMAKTSEPNSATSQFYINLVGNSQDLDSNYSVFGTVIAGMDVVDAIGQVATDSNDKPLQDVTIITAEFTP